MNCIAQSKDLADYLVSLTPICIAIFVAYIGFRQATVSRDKLRLDLYNKRFEIYEASLSFYQAISNYDGSKGEAFNATHRAFIKAMKESQFLFSSTSNIHKILQEISNDAFKVIGVKEGGEMLANADPVNFSRMHDDMLDTLTGFAFRIDAIEKAITPYLAFHKIVA